MGYGSLERAVFEGIIIKHSIQLKQGSATSLTIELKDEAVKMTVGRKNKIFENKTDSIISTDILKENHALGIIEPTELVHEEMVQYFCTDWDFILSRAEANGQLVFVDDGKVNFKTPETNSTSGYPN